MDYTPYKVVRYDYLTWTISLITQVLILPGRYIFKNQYDPVSAVGGMLNFILPSASSINSEKAEKYPFMFADTGVPAFIEALTDSGARIENMKVVIAGGAQILDQTGVFNIVHKNFQATKSILSSYKLAIHHEDICGIHSRRLSLNIGSGYSFLNLAGQREIMI